MKIAVVIVFLVLSYDLSCLPVERDPFTLPAKNKKKAVNKRLKLKGLVKQGKRLCALIEHGKALQVVAIGDSIGLFVVQQIDENSVTLVRGKKQTFLNF